MQDDMYDFYASLDESYALGNAEQFLLDCAEKARQAEPGGHTLITILNELGSLYRGTGRYEQSLASFQRATELAGQAFGEDCEEYATILNNMAGTYRLMKDYNRAIGLFSQAMEIYRRAGAENSYAYASVLNNLSLACRETRQFDLAISYLEQALSLIEAFPGNAQELAVTYNNLTALYSAVGKREKAMLCLNRALLEYEKCPEEQRVHYAAVLNSLAGFLFSQGEYQRAVMLYRKSAGYTLKFFGKNEEYGITYQNMRWAYEKLGDHSGVISALAAAKEVFEQVLGPNHERTRAVADDLRRQRERLGA